MWLQFDNTDCCQVSCPKAPASSWIFSWVMAEMSMTQRRVLSIAWKYQKIYTTFLLLCYGTFSGAMLNFQGIIYLKCKGNYFSIIYYSTSIHLNLQLLKVTVTNNTFGRQIGNVSAISSLSGWPMLTPTACGWVHRYTSNQHMDMEMGVEVCCHKGLSGMIRPSSTLHASPVFSNAKDIRGSGNLIAKLWIESF